EAVAFGTTRHQLRLAMMQYPLPTGSPAELRWAVAQSDALRRVRRDVSAVSRARLIGETRRWAMRNLSRAGVASRTGHRLAELFARFDSSAVKSWGESTWEAFTLRALWRVCRDGVAGLPSFAPAPPRPVRHRDLIR